MAARVPVSYGRPARHSADYHPAQETSMRAAQKLAGMTYAELKAAWQRSEISQVERDAWHLAFDGPCQQCGVQESPEAAALAAEIKALLAR